jgi:hypothetical protein
MTADLQTGGLFPGLVRAYVKTAVSKRRLHPTRKNKWASHAPTEIEYIPSLLTNSREHMFQRCGRAHLSN